MPSQKSKRTVNCKYELNCLVKAPVYVDGINLLYENKKFWDELFSHFSWYDIDLIENDGPTILLLLHVYLLPR
jgi:hypothetical protein